jgi:Anaphase-promoting complex subunit 4 WD40 domain
MDLIATVTQTCAVDVWRINGQRVFGFAPDEAGDQNIEGLAWRNDGTLASNPSIAGPAQFRVG